MRRVCGFIFSCLIGLLVFAASASAVEAAGYLKFDKSAVPVAAGSTFQIQVIVDPGTDSIAGTDAYVTYNASLLEAVSVAPGTYFPSVSHIISSGKVSLWGVTEPASPKTGVGTIATVTFRALSNGSATLQYFCDAASSSSSKIVKADINATNIINCSQNQSASVTISGGTAVTPTTGAGGTSQPAPTSPSSLPQSGGFEGMNQLAVGGIFLLLIGLLFRYIKV